MRGDRSSGTATVLFTDLVGSTELMSRLGDVAFDRLRGEHLLAELRRLRGIERLHLSGLDQAGVFAFVEAAAGHTLTEEEEDFPRIVWSETEGNPFFVAEVLRHLAESGAVAQRDDGRWFVANRRSRQPTGTGPAPRPTTSDSPSSCAA